MGNGNSLVYALVPLEWTCPLTLESSRQNCEAASSTTLETKIVTGGEKHEISAHLLQCLSPKEVLLKEILHKYLQYLYCNKLCVSDASTLHIVKQIVI